MNGKRVHIIGIVGQLSAPLAVALKKQGWKVTGSDQKKTFPPLTDYLLKYGLGWSSGYKKENISKDIDLVIIAGSALRSDPKNPEVKKSLSLKIKTISQAQAIEKFIIKKNSVVIAGTYGKTTTTAITASIFKQKLNPSYMIGGVPIDQKNPLEINKSNWSIVEGDEYPTLGFDKNSKFLYYHPKYLVLTAARWEHQDVFKTENDYIETFKKLAKMIPSDGFILASKKGENLKKVLADFKGKIYWYCLNKGKKVDFWVEKVKKEKDKQAFYLCGKTIKKPIKVKTKLFGQYNIENILAAGALARLCGLDEKSISKGVFFFSGIKKRMEVIGKYSGVTIISDFSQTKPRIEAAIKAAKEKFAGKTWVVFYPHYSGLQEKKGLLDLKGAFKRTDKVIITKVIFRKDILKMDRVSGSDFIKKLNLTENKAKYVPIDEKIPELIARNAKPEDVVIFMSSGSFRNIPEQTIKLLKEKKND